MKKHNAFLALNLTCAGILGIPDPRTSTIHRAEILLAKSDLAGQFRETFKIFPSHLALPSLPRPFTLQRVDFV
jgi:hypothetical protein